MELLFANGLVPAASFACTGSGAWTATMDELLQGICGRRKTVSLPGFVGLAATDHVAEAEVGGLGPNRFRGASIEFIAINLLAIPPPLKAR